MGNVIGKDQTTVRINRQIQRDKAATLNQVRLILLGSGDSGKSTFVRQMKLLKTGEYKHEELEYFRDQVRHNLVDWTILLADSLRQASEGQNKTTMDEDSKVSQLKNWANSGARFNEPINQRLAETIISITQRVAALDDILLKLPDSASYFFEKAAEILEVSYLPSHEDIVRCRITTYGIHELTFSAGKFSFTIIDVGGQRGQRRKWFHFFDNLDAMMFVSAISDYDKMLEEDGQTNRLVDSVRLFKVNQLHGDYTSALFLVQD